MNIIYEELPEEHNQELMILLSIITPKYNKFKKKIDREIFSSYLYNYSSNC